MPYILELSGHNEIVNKFSTFDIMEFSHNAHTNLWFDVVVKHSIESDGKIFIHMRVNVNAM